MVTTSTVTTPATTVTTPTIMGTSTSNPTVTTPTTMVTSTSTTLAHTTGVGSQAAPPAPLESAPIIGGIVGGIVVIMVGVVLIVFIVVCTKRSKSKEYNDKEQSRYIRN